ncbi:MAG: type II toxin-antitoxin system RelB/DinJ family antitoxin [Synergistaceae bacterium]|nr:type II toxin-antitoxin system RelB/DinJ family antitoxin [Synergistaceae bacterium]MBQ3399122.1 type II toxin-antitoxin system RelB/DinJ family antitoxin [Synergistaceae bacterium]MBQ4401962.1 type II toxin-antitoxin system RelB/DinJ family antitoxin [Synergistaceae bacterium]MBR0248015.1 type II toxin-antitoxin system RelB/DinJ family antitoxin [Synergistaceae bacterium]
MSTETAYVEVEPEIKRRAEEILDKIGMSYSMAVDLFTRQIVLRRAFPIELNVPERKPLCLGSMTEDEIDAAIQEGLDALEAGRTIPLEKAREEMSKRYGFKF